MWTFPLLAQQTAPDSNNAALITFLLYTVAVFAVAAFSNKLLQSKSFMSEYFLGSRSLGVWAFALTFAATSSSGGSFTGFPSRVYTHGWVLALWIGSYMVVPICAMGFMGKRLNQVSRISGAITVPDVVRDRFGSAQLGLLSVALIVFFMVFNLVAQFKAGSVILNVLLQDVELFKASARNLEPWMANIEFLSRVQPEYLICLLAFGVSVIAYTTYGGFHAVVWTDVMQGIVMVLGVLIMLPLALSQVGGMQSATDRMAEMTPPARRYATVAIAAPQKSDLSFNNNTWLMRSGGDAEELPRVFRSVGSFVIPAGQTELGGVELLEITTPQEVAQIAGGEKKSVTFDGRLDVLHLSQDHEKIGTATVLIEREIQTQVLRAGTWIAGKAAEGTLPRLFRVVRDMSIPANAKSLANVRVVESLHAEGNAELLKNFTEAERPSPFAIRDAVLRSSFYATGAGQPGSYVTGPGPAISDRDGFLPVSLAISFFFMWAISGSGQPSNMVRLMAFNSSTTLRRSMFTVAMYYTLIYFPLVMIFCCARVLVPGMEVEPDRIMPEMAVYLTKHAGVAWLAGLLIAAPFAAVMSTVDSFLLMISSAMVRDIYQRNISPDASEQTIKRLSYFFTLLVGTAAMLGAINPPRFLQDIIVYTGSGLAASFLAPMIYSLYWPRVNIYGATAAMLAGFVAHLAMYVAGIFVNGSFFSPYQPWQFDAIIIGLVVSFAAGYVVTLLTPPPPEALVRRYFYSKKVVSG